MGVLAVGAVACGGRGSGARTPAVERTATWGVIFERDLGIHADGLAIARDGDAIAAGGYRFDADGGYVGRIAMQIDGGEMLSQVRAILADGRMIVSIQSEPYGLMLGRMEQRPAEAARIASEQTRALALSADEARVATLEGRSVVVR